MSERLVVARNESSSSKTRVHTRHQSEPLVQPGRRDVTHDGDRREYFSMYLTNYNTRNWKNIECIGARWLCSLSLASVYKFAVVVEFVSVF